MSTLPALPMLPVAKQHRLKRFLPALAAIPNVVAIALGGSWASGTAKPDSDIDLGLYYYEAAPFSIDAVRAVANGLNDTPAPVVTGFGGWGQWVDGGAWLTVQGTRVDFLYRNLNRLQQVIDDCRAGEWESDYYQQFTHGFHSYIYLGELAIRRPLYDPSGILAHLKAQVLPYPAALKADIIKEQSWAAEFAGPTLRNLAKRGDVYNVAGGLNRVAAALTQVLFALNEQYFITDKGALEQIQTFALTPARYAERIRALLACPGATDAELLATVDQLEQLSQEVLMLGRAWYLPRFPLPGKS